MAVTTRHQSRGTGGSSAALTRVKDAGTTVASTARRVPGPARAAGAAAAGLAGGVLLGAHAGSRRTVLGLPVGRRRRGLAATARALGEGARLLGTTAAHASDTADEVRRLREQLAALNRRSPIEIVLDGLTHRRGAHRLES